MDLPLKGIWEHDLVNVCSSFDLFCFGSTESLEQKSMSFAEHIFN